MKNDLKIPGGSDYWGTYKGYNIYRYYGKSIPVSKDVVFAKDGILWLNGVAIGQVTESGNVLNWRPEEAKDGPKPKPVEKKPPVSFEAEKKKVPDMREVDAIIDSSWKRSIDDLVGDKLADYDNKYSL